ncbi:MAG: hypothetical protein IPP56_09545 [Bacteroidetes bacterium]|nr:hypothetical protein [Bacteroidota bacterium]MBK9799931.1 hypothetical protein [Bacteroidota bacterium]
MPLKYQNRIVAYIDILGFTEMIKNTVREDNPETSSQNLNAIYNIVANFQEYFNQIRTRRGLKDNCSITMFSDLIVFSQPQSESVGVLAMFEALKRLQINMLSKNILLRGSIVFGKLVHNQNIVIGPALINAYNVESKSAVYPRIVIDPKVMNLYVRKNGIIHRAGKKIKDLDYDITSDDFDGTYYIDYFNFVDDYLQNSKSSSYYEGMEKLIERGKKSQDTGIRMKYLWMDEKLKEAYDIMSRLKKTSDSPLHK